MLCAIVFLVFLLFGAMALDDQRRAKSLRTGEKCAMLAHEYYLEHGGENSFSDVYGQCMSDGGG